jgi:TatD DNase family protein
MLGLVDTHAHLDYIERAAEVDFTAVVSRIQSTGLSWLLNPTVHPDHYPDVIRLAEAYDFVYAAIAVHPCDVQEVIGEDWLEQARMLLDHPKVLAVGETGLDYFHSTEHVPRQTLFFKTFLELGREYQLPVIIHDREAHEDVARMVAACPGVQPVMHCFSGDSAFAEKMLTLNSYISFAGNVTFKNAHQLHQAAQSVPLNRLLLETDSPFLSPVPYRGQPNEPSRVQQVAEFIANLRQLPVSDLIEATTENAHRVFRPPC